MLYYFNVCRAGRHCFLPLFCLNNVRMMATTYKLPVPALEFITLDYIRATHDRIRPHIVRTPVLRNDYLERIVSEAVEADVKLYFKTELLQKTGAFKVRGALNAVMAAKEARNGAELPGVVTHSSGNHGASTAFAAQKLGVKAAIVVPSIASPAKIANISQYGAEVIKVDPRPECLRQACDEIVAKRDYTLLLPYNQKEIMGGQATCAVEFVEDIPQMEALLAPVSGGGLIAGLALGAKHLKPELKVFGVAPKAKQLGVALATQEIPAHWSPSTFIETQCDALRAHPGSLTFPIMCELLEKHAFDVTDADAAAAMRIAWQRLKLTVELSSATVISTVLSKEFANVVREQKLRHIGIILSGGNADLDAPLPWTVLKAQ